MLQQTVGNDQRPRLKLQANGVEIEGFTYEETMNFLDKIALGRENNEE